MQSWEERIEAAGDRLRRGEFDHLETVGERWTEVTDLKERLDLVQVHDVAEALSRAPQPVRYEDVIAQLLLSARHGEFGKTGFKVEDLLYLEADAPEGWRLTPLEIETARCMRLMWAKRAVLARWLGARAWPAPSWLAAVIEPPRGIRKGPAPGTTDKVAQQRRALFPEIDRRIKQGAKSATDAVRSIQEEGGALPGVGTATAENRAHALVKQYNRKGK